MLGLPSLIWKHVFTPQETSSICCGGFPVHTLLDRTPAALMMSLPPCRPTLACAHPICRFDFFPTGSDRTRHVHRCCSTTTTITIVIIITVHCVELHQAVNLRVRWFSRPVLLQPQVGRDGVPQEQETVSSSSNPPTPILLLLLLHWARSLFTLFWTPRYAHVLLVPRVTARPSDALTAGCRMF